MLLIGGYFFNWTWTGFGPYTLPNSNFQREKTLYDWLQLAIIPVALAVGVWWLNRVQQQRDQQVADRRAEIERMIARDSQQETALQLYFDRISELILEKNILELKPGREEDPTEQYTALQQIARARTLALLRQLDPIRKGSVLQFLNEMFLIHDYDVGPIVDLKGADLSEAFLNNANWDEVNFAEVDLREANLHHASLEGTKLSEAILIGADLFEAELDYSLLIFADLSSTILRFADLKHANLYGAILSEADLVGTDLRNADLTEAILVKVDLREAKLNKANLIEADLSGANLSNAKLIGADMKGATHYTTEQLDKAKSLKGATMPDGTKHD